MATDGRPESVADAASAERRVTDPSATLATDRPWAVQSTARVGNAVVRRGEAAEREIDVNDAKDKVEDAIRLRRRSHGGVSHCFL